MIAYGAPFHKVLEAVCRLVEDQVPDIRVSIFPTDMSGRYLRGMVAPSLPHDFCEQVGELEIQPHGPSCVRTAYSGEITIVEDTRTDPQYQPFLSLILPNQLVSAWSIPIIGRSGVCLGSFAMYHREVRTPTEKDITVLKQAALIAAIAIEDYRQATRAREEQGTWEEAVRAEKQARLHALASELALEGPGEHGRLEDEFCSLFAQALGIESAALWQQDPAAPPGLLKAVGMSGVPTEKQHILQTARVSIEPGSVAERAYQAGHGKLVWAHREDPIGSSGAQLMETFEVETLFCCALHTSATTYGLMYGISRTPVTPTPAQIANAEAIARILLGGFERHDLQAQARDQRSLIGSVMDHSLDMIATHEAGVFTSVSRACEAILGYAPEEMIGQPADAFIHPDDLERTYQEAVTVRDDGEVVLNFRNRYLHKDGHSVWLEWSGRVTGETKFLGIARDITLQREHAALVEMLLEQSLDLIVTVTVSDRVFVNVSPSSRAILGYTPEEMIGKTVEEFVHPDDLQTVADIGAALQAGTGSLMGFRQRFMHKLGHTVWIEWAGRILRDDVSFGIGRDITQQYQRDEQLKTVRRMNDRFSATLDLQALLDALIEEACGLIGAEGGCAGLYRDQGFSCARYYEQGRLIDFNYTWPEGHGLTGWLLEYKRPYLTNDAVNDPNVIPQLREVFGIHSALAVPILSGNGEMLGFINLHNKRNDQPFTADDQTSLEAVAQAATTAIQNALSMMKLQHAQEQVRKSERWYRAIAENETSFVFVVDAAGILKYVSPSVSRHLGYAPESLVNRSLFDIVGPKYATILQKRFELRRSGQDSDLTESVILRVFHANGSRLWLEAKGSNQLQDPDIQGVVVNARDITHLHAANQQLEMAKRELEKRLDRLTALHEIDLAITSSLDMRLVLNVVLDQTLQQLGADAATVMLVRQGSQEMYCAASRGIRSMNLRQATVRLGEDLVLAGLLQERSSQRLNLMDHVDKLQRPDLVTQERFVEYHGVPLISKGKLLGVLEIFGRSPLPEEADWVEFAEMLGRQTSIAIEDANLFRDLQHSNLELTLAYDRTIEGWARALDLRDEETEGHSQRVTELTVRLVRELNFTEEQIVQVRRGALLHDIGKMGVPDSILLKPGKLTDEEWVIMKQHPELALNLLSPIDFLRPALDIPYSHHEKWDGSGYPRGLKGHEIPLAARAFALVDVWDALRSDRPYRKGWPTEKITQYIQEEAGRHFDPELVPVFLRMIDAPAGGL
ncbi:PAS domain S-box protein [Deinococcus deserti]|nr:PAS domain S-box protein [Deinococcus deserti]